MFRINGLRVLVVTAAVALAAGFLVLVAAGKLFGPASTTHGSSESNSLSAVQSDPEGEGEGGSALVRHMEALKEAVPGNGGEPAEGPESAAEAEFEALAYPDNTIAVSEMDAARRAFSKMG